MLVKLLTRARGLYWRLIKPNHTSKKETSCSPVDTCQIPPLATILGYYLGKQHGLFIEVGAYDGISFSNTYHLAQAGWEGIYCEPVSEYARKCSENHSTHPNVKVLQLAISDTDNSMLEIETGGVFSTASKIARNYFLSQPFSSHHFNGSKRVKVPTLTLASLVDRYGITNIDVLVIDVEGHELSVLEGLDISRNRPSVIIVELQEVQHGGDALSIDYARVRLMLHRHDYVCVYADLINSIFVEVNLYRQQNSLQ